MKTRNNVHIELNSLYLIISIICYIQYAFVRQPEGDFLKSSMVSNFGQLDKSEKRRLLGEQNVGITTYGLPHEVSDQIFEAAQRLGLSPIRIDEVTRGISHVMEVEGNSLPEGKKAKRERAKVVDGALSKIDLRQDENGDLRIIYCREQDGETIDEDITETLRSDTCEHANLANALAADQMALGRVINFVSEHLSEKKTVAVEQTSPGQYDFNGPRLIIAPDGATVVEDKKRADGVVSAMNEPTTRFGILRESTRYAQIQHQRRQIEDKIASREVQAVPKFTFDKWPTDPLMTHLRHQVAEKVAQFDEQEHPLCDIKDLKYQTLFRLTTVDVPDLFVNGQQLEEYLIAKGAYGNWRNILRLDPGYVANFQLNPEVLDAVMKEQYQIIAHRLESSNLPLEGILRPTGMFAEPGWVIQRKNGCVNAVQEDTANALADAIPLDFRQMDPEAAAAYHRDLHYIHTPRADLAFGLFVQGEEHPFSVVALEKIDRDYKRNALIFQGYDPRECFDLTRLYSKPGTPGNTSSSMFTLAFQYLKANYPDTQAILSSFMPSYATGVSMTSGGFNNPVLIKPLAHRFVETTIDGQPHYEHMTNRRLAGQDGKFVRSRIPLLPTVELMSTLRPPRYTPLPHADTHMLETY